MPNPIINGIQYQVKIGSKPSFHITKERTMASNYLRELVDTNFGSSLTRTTSDPTKEKYLVSYNSTTNKFLIIDPDEVLVAAASSTTVQPGLPSPFIEQMGIDLDNEINLDAGFF
jgi:hypothetical protein